MTISLPTAKRLCTAREYNLVQSSRPRAVHALSDRDLRAHVERARKARDTFRDKARSQRREQRGTVRPRSGRRADGNDRTVAKEKLFTQVLAAFTAEVTRRKAVGKSHKTTATRTPAKAQKAKVAVSRKTKAKVKAKPKRKTTAEVPTKAKPKSKSKPKARTSAARATAPKGRRPSEKAAPPVAPVAKAAPPAVRWEEKTDHGTEGNLAAVHQPIPAITRRGRSLLATDVTGKRSMKRIPLAQRRARYGSVSALGRRNQARRDGRG